MQRCMDRRTVPDRTAAAKGACHMPVASSNDACLQSTAGKRGSVAIAMTAGHSSFDYETAAQVFRVLRARATLYAVVGTLIAIIAVVLATLLVCVHVYDGITTNNIMLAHRENIAIQALDAMPFLFAWWGQYASSKMAAEAGSMVKRRTDDLKQELADARFTAQTKTDFFARMSHELRTPINAIGGACECWRSGRRSRRVSRSGSRVDGAASRSDTGNGSRALTVYGVVSIPLSACQPQPGPR